jgi:hypothetical protein
VPFIWLALLLSSALGGLFLQSALFLALSALFIAGLYYLAINLNMRYGLYEPPAITVQKGGVYAPKAGLLGRLGFSNVEAAIIRKDLRAFTRRRELIGVYIAPIIMIIVPILNSLNIINNGAPAGQVSLIFAAIIFLLPCGFMAMLLGEVLIGEEGQAVWRIYASPISPKSYVKSKYFFVILFSTIILLISGSIGTVFYRPPLQLTIVAFIEPFFVLLAIGGVALTVGFKGPDFSQSRRARMIRQEWSLIGVVVCAVAGGAVLAPITATIVISFLAHGSINSANFLVPVIISGVISAVITAVFYRINIGMAADFLKKAEV